MEIDIYLYHYYIEWWSIDIIKGSYILDGGAREPKRFSNLTTLVHTCSIFPGGNLLITFKDVDMGSLFSTSPAILEILAKTFSQTFPKLPPLTFGKVLSPPNVIFHY